MLNILFFNSNDIFVNLVYSTFLNWILIYFLIHNFKVYIPYDFPVDRSSHRLPTLTGGGITFGILFSLVGLFNEFYLPLIILPLSFISFVDDIKSLSINLRYFSQVITVIFIIKYSGLYELLAFNLLIKSFIIMGLIFLGTAIINFSNFIDGIDGLLAFSMILIIISELFYGNYIYTFLIGFLLGFLIWNFPNAKIFMGDSGSVYLGGIYCYLIFSSNDFMHSLELFIIGSPLWFDTFITLIRRIIIKDSIFKSHKKHLYQRLTASGWGHKKVVLLYVFNIFSLLLLSQFGSIKLLFLLAFILFAIMIVIDKKFALPFDKAI